MITHHFLDSFKGGGTSVKPNAKPGIDHSFSD